ncbi:anti-sigma factor family protein [Bounagaea algeriensis]
MNGVRGWGFSEQHLALDAIVAFVDGELSANARDRAASHLAHCSACTTEASTQRQARSAVRDADSPAISSDLVRNLLSIPQHTELPAQPEELALSEEGQLLTSQRLGSGTTLGDGAPLGSGTSLANGTPLGNRPVAGSTPLGSDASQTSEQDADRAAQAQQLGQSQQHGQSQRHGGKRRTRHGAGVVFSGLMLGALALVNPPSDEQETTPQQASLPDGDSRLPATARTDLAPTSSSASTSPAPPAPQHDRAPAGAAPSAGPPDRVSATAGS